MKGKKISALSKSFYSNCAIKYQENMIPFFSNEKKVAISSVSRDDSYIHITYYLIPSNIAL